MIKRYLSRWEVRDIIAKCLKLKLTLTEIKQTVKEHERRMKSFATQEYGW